MSRQVPESVSPALAKSGDWKRQRTWYQCVSGSVGAVDSHTVMLGGAQRDGEGVSEVPGGGLGGCWPPPRRLHGADEGDVEPEGEAVHQPRVQHVELEGDFYPGKAKKGGGSGAGLCPPLPKKGLRVPKPPKNPPRSRPPPVQVALFGF